MQRRRFGALLLTAVKFRAPMPPGIRPSALKRKELIGVALLLAMLAPAVKASCRRKMVSVSARLLFASTSMNVIQPALQSLPLQVAAVFSEVLLGHNVILRPLLMASLRSRCCPSRVARSSTSPPTVPRRSTAVSSRVRAAGVTYSQRGFTAVKATGSASVASVPRPGVLCATRQRCARLCRSASRTFSCACTARGGPLCPEERYRSSKRSTAASSSGRSMGLVM